MQESQNIFGARVDQALARLRMSKSDLARATGLANSTISRWYTGTQPSGDTLQALARTLRVSPHWLMTGDGPMVGLTSAETAEAADLRALGGSEPFASMLAAGPRGAAALMSIDRLTAVILRELLALVADTDAESRGVRAVTIEALVKELALRATPPISD